MLQSKAVAGETALDVVDVAMRVGGGAAFRKDIGIERHFRDARASAVMAPTVDALQEFIGRALCGMALFG
jgi:alkylation response protein AidB-like acyl-CoA dehydrogenase